MLFLDVLRRYLGEVESVHGTPVRAGGPSIDLPAARRHFLEALEAFGKRGDRSYEGPPYPWEWLDDREHAELDAFLLLVASELNASLCAGTDAQTLQVHVHQAVRVLLELPIRGLSRVRQRELARIAEYASETVESGWGIERIARYALEVRAARRAASGTTLSGIGRVLLGLPETDAIRWLLTLEILQSMGPRDEWHTPVEALEVILRWPQNVFCMTPDMSKKYGRGGPDPASPCSLPKRTWPRSSRPQIATPSSRSSTRGRSSLAGIDSWG